MPPTTTSHILLSLIDIQVIINIFSNEISKDIISGTITGTIFDHLPQL